MIDDRDAKIVVLTRRADRLEEENRELLRRIHGDIGVRACDVDGTMRFAAMDMPQAREVLSIIGDSLAMILSDAENYVTMRVHHPAKGWIEFVVQRADKITPAEGRRKAEAECAKMLEFIRTNGLDYEPSIELRPEWYQPVVAEASVVGAEWLVLDYREKPNRLRCLRCGASEEVPDPVTTWMYQAMQAKFNDFHRECVAK